MNTFTYHVGVPAEDAFFLLSGFSDPHYEEGVSWRNCSRVFRFHVPAAGSGETRITLRMRFIHPSFRLDIRRADQALGTIAPAEAGWRDYTITLPPTGPAAAGQLVTLIGEFDREPYDPPLPKVDPNRSFIDLSQVTAESADGTDLVLPENCRRKRTARLPIRIANCRRSEQKGRNPAD
ncbi:unnamed protein product, partial [marine sediment metagenome]